MILLLAALLVLGVVGTAGAQETIDGGRLTQVSPEMFSPAQFDLAAPWGVIDAQDLLPLQLALGRPMDGTIPSSWDINRDGMIDIIDLGMVAARYDCTAADACYWR